MVGDTALRLTSQFNLRAQYAFAICMEGLAFCSN